MADVGTVVASLVYGVHLGFVFAAIAHGLNLIWGVTKVVNAAHGEFIMLGAYGAYFLNLAWGLDPLLAAVVDAALGLAIGGLSVPLGGVYVGLASLGIIAVSHVFLSRTYLGNAIRAYSQDIAAAKLMGVNPTSVAAIATGIGFAMTMASGALLTVYLRGGITPLVGLTYAPISFVIVVLGGRGKMWGSLVGGVTIGVLLDVLQAFVAVEIAYAAAFLVVIPVLALAPEGILR